MNPSEVVFVSAILYKAFSMIIGLMIVFFGYKLFMAGIFAQQGDFQANFGDNKIFLKKAAPGTFFVLFGSIVISLTILKGISIENSEEAERTNNETKVSLPEVAPW